MLSESVKEEEGVMIWACFAAEGPGQLQPSPLYTKVFWSQVLGHLSGS